MHKSILHCCPVNKSFSTIFSRFHIYALDQLQIFNCRTLLWNWLNPKVVLVVKNSSANTGYIRDSGLIPGLGRFPWRRAWQSTPVFLPGEYQGERSLVGYSPWSQKESDMTEVIACTRWEIRGYGGPTVFMVLCHLCKGFEYLQILEPNPSKTPRDDSKSFVYILYDSKEN